MIAPEYHIRDCVEADMDLIRYLFSVEGFSDLTSPEGIRVAVTPDNTMYGACRLEQGSDGSWNVRPIVVFDVVQGKGVGRALLKDALRLHPDLRLVARGEIEPFYLSCGFERCGWDAIAPEYRAECDACPDKAACAPLPFRSLPIERTFTFLGTSSGCGVPAFFCHCPACEAARKDPTKRRGCTGVALRGHGTTIIDASPDIRHQLNREGIDVIDDFFLTHAHYDHMGGLGEFEYFIRLYLMGTMPFHGSEHAIAEALKEYSYMDDCFALDVMNPYDVREVDGLAIQALPLKHAPVPSVTSSPRPRDVVRSMRPIRAISSPRSSRYSRASTTSSWIRRSGRITGPHARIMTYVRRCTRASTFSMPDTYISRILRRTCAIRV